MRTSRFDMKICISILLDECKNCSSIYTKSAPLFVEDKERRRLCVKSINEQFRFQLFPGQMCGNVSLVPAPER